MTRDHTNPLLDEVEAMAERGLHPSAVHVRQDGDGWTMRVTLQDWVHAGEGGDLPHHRATLDTTDMPDGVTVRGWDRWEDHVARISGEQYEIELWIHELAQVGEAEDWARFDGEDGPSYLVKPNRWLRD